MHSLRYIRAHVATEADWRFTRIDALPERLARIARLQPAERSLVSCFIDAQRWYVMTTARVFGIAHGSPFDCSPLDVTQWRWGDFKHAGRSESEIATLSMKNGTHLRMAYETGPASMAPIYYDRFWTIKYPILDKLE
jgi:hypothetical protein